MNLLHHIKLGIAIMLSSYEFSVISSSLGRRNIELEVKKCKLEDAKGNMGELAFSLWHSEIFEGIAKISQW